MTAKEKLRQAIEDLSELEAEQTLAFIAPSRDDHDPIIAAFEDAPDDDESTTPEEDRNPPRPGSSATTRSRSENSSASSVERRLAHRDHASRAARPQTPRPASLTARDRRAPRACGRPVERPARQAPGHRR